MSIDPGKYTFNPDNAELLVKTGREGSLAKVGKELTIEVTEWEATLEMADDPAQARLELNADGGSLRIREGEGGPTALTDPDKDSIRETIDEEVLKRTDIKFHSTSVEPGDQDGVLRVQGDLELLGQTTQVNFELVLDEGEEDEEGEEEEDEQDEDEQDEDRADDEEVVDEEADTGTGHDEGEGRQQGANGEGEQRKSEDGGEPQASSQEQEGGEDENDRGSEEQDGGEDEGGKDEDDDGDEWSLDQRRVSATTTVKQTELGIEPHSTLFGTLRAADEVEITFSGRLNKSE